MTRLRSLPSRLHPTDTSTVRLAPKVKDPIYTTPEFSHWRSLVLARAGYQCEATDQHGHRCSKARPEHRLFADHIIELKDGGSLLDVNNGKCLCYQHHSIKTFAEQRRRLRATIS